MKTYSFYDVNGTILRSRITCETLEEAAMNTPPGSTLIEGALDPATHYVSSASVNTTVVGSGYLVGEVWTYASVQTLTLTVPAVVPRPPSPVTYVSTGMLLRIDSIPPDGIVTVWGDTDPTTYVPTSGWWEGEFDPGLYYTRVEAFPYLTFTDARSF
jgi:hypothetical protein